MIEFKKNYLTGFMIRIMFFIILISMSVFSTTMVNAEEREGYIMFDRVTHQVYYPEETVENESNLKSSIDPKSTISKSTNLSNVEGGSSSEPYLEPELNIPAVKATEPLPLKTYENRTSFQGIEPVNYIPVKFKVDRDYFPNNDMMLKVLNDALNDQDPNVITFIGVYDPVTESVTNYFPLNAPDEIILLLNKDSYFAEGLTLDVEEWWETEAGNYGNSGGSPVTKTINRTFGIQDSKQDSTMITHGTGVDLSLGFKIEKNAMVIKKTFEFGTTVNYNYSNSSTTAFTRTYHSSRTDSFQVQFGTKYPGTAYKWAVYDLVTRTKVNYSNAPHFSELDDAFKNINNYGLTPDISYTPDVESYHLSDMKNAVYSVVEVPIYDQDNDLSKPNHLTATQDFQNLTITLNWEAVSEDKIAQESDFNNGKVAGYFVYKNDHLAATIFDPTRTSWTDLNVEPRKENTYYLRSFSNNQYVSTKQFYRQISPNTNVVTETVELDAAEFSRLVVGCSIPFTLTDNQEPAGEGTYYILYIGNPATGGEEVGRFVGKENAINLSPELYDLLKENTDEEFYVVKEVLYNEGTIRSSAVRMPGQHFTVTETAFLFSEAGFNGDCVTVSKTSDWRNNTNLNTSINFDNRLSSMLVQGNVLVYLFGDLDGLGNKQTFFTDENGYAYVRDFNDELIGSNIVSSIRVMEKKAGVYLFTGPDYYGRSSHFATSDKIDIRYNDPGMWQNSDEVSSVKVIGPYAYVGYEHGNYSGKLAIIKEGYDGRNLGSMGMDNRVSSMSVIHGEGVWFFDGINFGGNHKRLKPNSIYNCSWSADCGIPNDTLSSVLVIGDYGVGMFLHRNYSGFMYPTRHHISDMENSSGLGDNNMSSFRIFPKGVYLGDKNHLFVGGVERHVTTPGEYRFIEQLGFPDNKLSAMFVIGDYRVTLYRDPIFRGGSTVATDGWYDGHLGNQAVGENDASSIIIEEY
ncbi:hypothetical protein VQL36_10245 [Chengkuizengella sp. SCS-71B]|uniref:hypothetical protein n=1 Tax=Chengkuizengella sp. SCS-71B TaxID=3115290 RepID=UPI0032C22194